MTPEQRFDKVWQSYLGQTFSFEDDAVDWLKEKLCLEMREVVEEVARIVDPAWTIHLPNKMMKEPYSMDLNEFLKMIANQIRAKAKDAA